ncbi:hypothetical protein ACSZM0_09575 [Aeromonas hydrophila]
MTDLDRFIIELDRVKTLVHFYDELYGSDETINVLNKLSPQGIQIIQRSLHDDILMSIARVLYDGQCYKYKKSNMNISVYVTWLIPMRIYWMMNSIYIGT